jgi:hypothetical protein
MDLLGRVVREYMKKAHTDNVRNATNLAMEFRDEHMNDDQIEEMLYSSGFDTNVVSEAMENIIVKKKAAR